MSTGTKGRWWMASKRTEAMAETRDRLVRAARRAFAQQGFAAASMDDLTASAGLTRGALYHHFGDKKGLLTAVIAQIDGEMAERLANYTVHLTLSHDAGIASAMVIVENR